MDCMNILRDVRAFWMRYNIPLVGMMKVTRYKVIENQSPLYGLIIIGAEVEATY